ncbi:maturase K [Gossypium australe]|uniref:Maturase K n=1 Tax=Gossypium australe TaxID=47621 RepID=A0A5B6UW84_9ROSI|nr:maturase K [Gossypium australe]
MSVVSRERVNWEIFQDEFRKKYISQRFIDQKLGVLELKEFVVLFDIACKAEELSKEKRRAKIETRDSRKRLMSKSFMSQSKKSRDLYARSSASATYSNRKHGKQYSGSKA